MTAAKVELPPGMPALRVTPMPADANFHGDIFGGWIMSQVDLAGSIPASRRARGRVTTVAVNSFLFKQPVLIGDVVSFFATIEKTGRTSITVSVEVYAQRNTDEQITVTVTEASRTYVAAGTDRRRDECAPAGPAGPQRTRRPPRPKNRAAVPTRQSQRRPRRRTLVVCRY